VWTLAPADRWARRQITEWLPVGDDEPVCVGGELHNDAFQRLREGPGIRFVAWPYYDAKRTGRIPCRTMNGERPRCELSDFFQMLSKTPLHDLPNEVFVVLGSSDEEPFDLVIRRVRAFFREGLPQIHKGSVVSHDHAFLSRAAAFTSAQ